MAAPLQVYTEPRNPLEIERRLAQFNNVFGNNMLLVHELYFDSMDKLIHAKKIDRDDVPTLDNLYRQLNEAYNCGSHMSRAKIDIFTTQTCLNEFDILSNSAEFAKIWWGYTDTNYGFNNVVELLENPEESVYSDVKFINTNGIDFVVKTSKIHDLNRYIINDQDGEHLDLTNYERDLCLRFMRMIHEIFVNVMGINQLRIPCLVDIIRVCMVQDQHSPRFMMPVIIQERAPGVSLNEMLSTINERQFLEIFLQIFLALWYCNDMIQFIHFDLHDNNIMIEQLARYEQFNYNYEDNGEIHNFSFYSEYNVKLIDYGMSSMVYNDTFYGIHYLTNMYVCPNVENAFLGDLHKLLKIIHAKFRPFHIVEIIRNVFESIFQNEDITVRYNNSWSFPFYNKDNTTYFDIFSILISNPLFDQLNIVID